MLPELLWRKKEFENESCFLKPLLYNLLVNEKRKTKMNNEPSRLINFTDLPLKVQNEIKNLIILKEEIKKRKGKK